MLETQPNNSSPSSTAPYIVLDADTGVTRPATSIKDGIRQLSAGRDIEPGQLELIDRSSSCGTVEQYECRVAGEYIGAITAYDAAPVVSQSITLTYPEFAGQQWFVGTTSPDVWCSGLCRSRDEAVARCQRWIAGDLLDEQPGGIASRAQIVAAIAYLTDNPVRGMARVWCERALDVGPVSEEWLEATQVVLQLLHTPQVTAVRAEDCMVQRGAVRS